MTRSLRLWQPRLRLLALVGVLTVICWAPVDAGRRREEKRDSHRAMFLYVDRLFGTQIELRAPDGTAALLSGASVTSSISACRASASPSVLKGDGGYKGWGDSILVQRPAPGRWLLKLRETDSRNFHYTTRVRLQGLGVSDSTTPRWLLAHLDHGDSAAWSIDVGDANGHRGLIALRVDTVATSR